VRRLVQWGNTPPGAWIVAGSTGLEVQGELGAGDLSDRRGTSDVHGVGGAEVGQLRGGLGDGGVEVERVGQVEDTADVDGPAEQDRGVAQVDVEEPRLICPLAPCLGFERAEVS